MNLSAKYFIDVLMILICLVIITFINHKISLEVTILDPSRHLAYSRNSIISHLKTQQGKSELFDSCDRPSHLAYSNWIEIVDFSPV